MLEDNAAFPTQIFATWVFIGRVPGAGGPGFKSRRARHTSLPRKALTQVSGLRGRWQVTAATS